MKDAKLDTFGASIGAVASYLFGSFDTLLMWLAIAMVMDIVTGMLASARNGEPIVLRRAWEGLITKLLTACGVILAQGLAVNTGVAAFRVAFVGGFFGYEIMSNLKNLAKGKVMIPQQAVDWVQKFIDTQAKAFEWKEK